MESKLADQAGGAPFVAVVAGATGATGRWIVSELTSCDQCSKIVALVRSPEVDLTPSPKLELLNWDQIDTLNCCTVGFCAMGSAPYTEESDFIRPVAFAKRCREIGVKDMFLVSASNAKTGSWFGYPDTLGRREDAFIQLGFTRLGIFRPGMMNRQEKRRTREQIFSMILPDFMKIDTRDIAKTMVAAAMRMKPGTHYFSHGEMKTFARA